MALFPSRTIAWYTARMFIIRAAAFLIGLIIILESLDLLGESGKILAAAGNGEAELWTYVSLRVPQLIQLFLPFSVLLATLITLATLNQNSEVVIFKAAGLSAHQILLPLLIAAFGVAVANFAFNETVTTRATRTLKVWQENDYARVPPEKLLTTESWVRGGNDLFHAETVRGVGANTVLSSVTIYDRLDDRLIRVVMAGTARPVANGWQLTDVTSFDVGSGRRTVEPTLFFESSVVPRQFTTASINPAFVPLWELWPQIAEQRAAGKPVDPLVAAAWHKISGPLSTVLMPLLGAVAAFGLARSGRLFVRAVIGMFLGFAFFVADNFMLAMGNFGTVPPLMAAWAPFLLFLLIGEAVLIRTEE
ncbi:LPS export ABC transporter permease LptG [Polymorphobacter fuscus]|uniref:LPS export ABC transporter permease LptG n=1 Tax=Sandarakinorhabdus fusca TaxID=1439888 RepID=A0A7C9KY06_9SPHN|nr:LPS export ABC transporter permease LptG [Polymorphobacter fuscus]KAB7646445.1 LPS export ABC transporter permease LptG [Polymorphobacter fuscus]MQT17686.1 LPS export ABC transporter permease LptG [Polymorphobacter fuscus]NJC09769.1 lipopolysaccharide export system permease protein [Polymorphobacter fuscus]